jgi:hypothetical protein
VVVQAFLGSPKSYLATTSPDAPAAWPSRPSARPCTRPQRQKWRPPTPGRPGWPARRLTSCLLLWWRHRHVQDVEEVHFGGVISLSASNSVLPSLPDFTEASNTRYVFFHYSFTLLQLASVSCSSHSCRSIYGSCPILASLVGLYMRLYPLTHSAAGNNVSNVPVH